MKWLLPAIAAIVPIALTGAVSGIWTQRWVPVARLASVMECTQLPLSAGDWDGEEQPVSPQELQASQATAIVRRVYVHRKTGNAVSVAMISGRAGPISVHTPDVCFPSNGYEVVGKRKRIDVGDSSGCQFWVQRFQKHVPTPSFLCTYYGWSDGGRWQASDNPRFSFAARSTLFKLYFTVLKDSAISLEADDSVTELIQVLLPLLRTTPESGS